MAEEATEVPRDGWFRSPGGVLAHADGPSQVRAFTGRGYTPVDDAEARKEIGDGLRLEVDRTDSKGTFDAEAVKQAVRDEGSQAAARSAAARKAAVTRRAHKAAAEQAAKDAANTESDAIGTSD